MDSLLCFVLVSIFSFASLSYFFPHFWVIHFPSFQCCSYFVGEYSCEVHWQAWAPLRARIKAKLGIGQILEVVQILTMTGKGPPNLSMYIYA